MDNPKLSTVQKQKIRFLSSLFTQEISLVETFLKASNVPNLLETETFACVGVTIVGQSNVERMLEDDLYDQKHFDYLKKLQPVIHNLCQDIRMQLFAYTNGLPAKFENSDEAVFEMLDRTQHGTLISPLIQS